MALLPFDDASVTQYINGLSVEELGGVVEELRVDFDQAILSRFELSPSQQQSLAAMTPEEKEAISAMVGLFHAVRSAGRSANVVVEGLRTEAAVARPKELELEARHYPDCTWVFRITFRW